MWARAAGAVRILRIDSWDGAPGGAQDYIREVSRELASLGHTTHIVQIGGRSDDRLSDTVYRIARASSRIGRLGEDVLAGDVVEGTLAQAVRELNPDLISLHHFDARFASIARYLRTLDVPLVFAAHDAELVCPISTLVRPGGIICDGGVRLRCLFTGCHVGLGGAYNLWQTRVFDSAIRGRVRAYLCPSRSLTDYLHLNGYRPALHLPSFSRIPPEVRRAAPAQPGPDLPPSVGYIGRLEWYKGVADLIQAIPALARRVPEVRIEIAGTGPLEAALRQLAARLRVSDRIRWHGHVSGEAKERWFSNVHVVAFPSSMWENFGLVALEALARERPVVGSRIGGIPEIVEDGVCGRLVPPASPDRLAEALGDLLLDPVTARRVGEAGRRRVLEMFTPELHVQRLLKVYRQVLEGKRFDSGIEADSVGG